MTLVVVAVLLGALAWWYLGRDDAGSKDPTLTLTVGGVTASTVTVSWTLDMDGAQFQSYELAYKTTTDTQWTTSTRTTSDPQTHTFRNLVAGTTYLFRVTARFEADDAVDDQLTAYTLGDDTAVGGSNDTVDDQITTGSDVITLTLTAGPVTDSTAKVSWTTPQSGTPVDSYLMEYKKDTDMAWMHSSSTVDASGQEYTFQNLQHDTTYEFRVTAQNADSDAVAIGETGATTASPIDVQPWVSANTHVSVQVTWTPLQSARQLSLAFGDDSNTAYGPPVTLTGLSANTSYALVVSANADPDAGLPSVYSTLTFETLPQPTITNVSATAYNDRIDVTWQLSDPFPQTLGPKTSVRYKLHNLNDWNEALVDNSYTTIINLESDKLYSIVVKHHCDPDWDGEISIVSQVLRVQTLTDPPCDAWQLTCSGLGAVVKLQPDDRCTAPSNAQCSCRYTGASATAATAILDNGVQTLTSDWCACDPDQTLQTTCNISEDDRITYTGYGTETWDAAQSETRDTCFNGETKYSRDTRNRWWRTVNAQASCPTPTDCEFDIEGGTDCMYANTSESGLIRNFTTVHQELDVANFQPAANGGQCRAARADVRGGRMGTERLTHKYKLSGEGDEVPRYSRYCATEEQDADGFYTLRPQAAVEGTCVDSEYPQEILHLYMHDCADLQPPWDSSTCVDFDDGRKVKRVNDDGSKSILTRSLQRPMGIHLKMDPIREAQDHCIDPPDDQGVSTLRVKGSDDSCDTFRSPANQCSRNQTSGLCYDGQGLVRDASDGFNAYFHPSQAHGMIPFDSGKVTWTNHDTCPERLDCYYEVEPDAEPGQSNCVPGLQARRYRITNFTGPAQGLAGLQVGNACTSVPYGTTTLGPSNVPHSNGTFLAADDGCLGDPFEQGVSRYRRTYLTGLPGKATSEASAMLGPMQYADENKHYVTPRDGTVNPTPAICESKCDAEKDCKGFAATRFLWPNNQPGVACRFFKDDINVGPDTVQDAGFTLYTKTDVYAVRKAPTCSLTMQFSDEDATGDDAENFWRVWPSFYSEWDHDDYVDLDQRVKQAGKFDYLAPTKLKPEQSSALHGRYTWSVEAQPGYTCGYQHDLHTTNHIREYEESYFAGKWPDNADISLYSTREAGEAPEEEPDTVSLPLMFRFILFNADRDEVLRHDWSVDRDANGVRHKATLTQADDLIPGRLVYQEENSQRLTEEPVVMYYTLVSARPNHRPSGYLNFRVMKLGDSWPQFNLWADLEATSEMKELSLGPLARDRFVFISQSRPLEVTLSADAYDVELSGAGDGRRIHWYYDHGDYISSDSQLIYRTPPLNTNVFGQMLNGFQNGLLVEEDAASLIDALRADTWVQSVMFKTHRWWGYGVFEAIVNMIAERDRWYVGA